MPFKILNLLLSFLVKITTYLHLNLLKNNAKIFKGQFFSQLGTDFKVFCRHGTDLKFSARHGRTGRYKTIKLKPVTQNFIVYGTLKMFL